MENWQAIVVGLFVLWALIFFVLRTIRFFARLSNASPAQGQKSCCTPGAGASTPIDKKTLKNEQPTELCDQFDACAHCPLHNGCNLEARITK